MSVIDAVRPEGASALSTATAQLPLGALFSQRQRLLALDTPLGANTLLVERFSGREAVNEVGGFQIDCLSLDAYLDLHPLVGQEISLHLQGAGLVTGQRRTWHGIVTSASALGADGGFARYRLQLQPWIALLDWRRDSFIYQDKTALQIIEDVFADYPMAKWRVAASAPLRTRSLCTQYEETDLAFVQRLLREEGLSYFIEQSASGSGNSGDGKTWQHTLVLFDDQSEAPDLGALPFTHGELRTPLGATEGITAWAPRQRVQANRVNVSSWDYRTLSLPGAQTDSAAVPAGIGALEIYDGSGAYRHADAAGAERRAALMLAAAELERDTVDAASASRAISAAGAFTLQGRALASLGALAPAAAAADGSAPRFRVLAVEHEAANNLGAQAALLLRQAEADAGTYRNRFTAVPATTRVVPPGAGQILKPAAPGALTALVVTAQQRPLTTDRELRVKLQFPWQRGSAPAPGGLAHDSTADTQGNAPGDDRSGTWVRVAQPSAGANWGSVFVPRTGTEVLVGFVEGDIDRPVVTGQLYNGTDTPPLAAGVDSGVNHPGVISGLTVPTLDQAQLNQWVMDDATGQLRLRLASSASTAELGLGHLIAQGRDARRGAWLGSGFQMHSADWTQLRAGSGLSLSSTKRAGTYGSAASTALDGAEALAQLRAAHALGQRLSDSAQAQHAAALGAHHSTSSAPPAWDAVLTSLEPALKPPPDDPRGAPETLPEAMTAPAIVLDTPASATWVSEASTALFAAQDLSVVTQGDSQASAGHTLGAVSGSTTSLYTHTGGIQATAGQGPLSLRAHTDTLEILSEGALSVTSVQDSVRVQASTKIVLTAGGARITLEGANISFACPGAFTVKAATHAWEGPGGGAAALPALPVGSLTESPQWIELRHTYEDLEPVVGATYKVVFENGTVRQGVLDSSGFARIDGVKSGVASVEYGADTRAWKPPPERVNADYGAATDEAAAAALYKKYLGGQA